MKLAIEPAVVLDTSLVVGLRLYERNVLDDGTEIGAWMSLTIAAHELIYVADNAGGRGRLHHVAFWVDTREEVLRAADIFVDSGVPIEAAPSKHSVSQGFFLYGFEPGGTGSKSHRAATSSTHPTILWSCAPRRRWRVA